MQSPLILHTLLRRTPTIAPVAHRAVISITGSQASEFLNGILSSSVKHPARPGFSSLLHAQGRVLYDVFLYTQAGKAGYLLEYDSRPSEAPALLSLLKRYILRSKVKARDVSEEFDVWAAWGSEVESKWETHRDWRWAASRSVEPVWDPTANWPWGTKDESLQDRRAVGMGRRMLVKKGDLPREASNYDRATSDDYTLHRILHGVPEGIIDIPPMHSFPMDSNLDVMGAIDYRKGCYIGQELTARTYHTGVVRKRILPVLIHLPGVLVPGNIMSLDSSIPNFDPGLDIHANRKASDESLTPRPRGTGKLLTSLRGVGLALLRLEHTQATNIELLVPNDGLLWQISHWSPDWWPQSPHGIQ